ncbi:amidohydrolase [Microbacterium indicum]|uniref:amidohydrolase n=1 Tax=Microbacterium indicum TaxID=358100 RepID=UPI000421AD57|nr:amidohydrolase [Microbacterium indicum]
MSTAVSVPTDIDALKREIEQAVESRREQLLALSHAINADPELSWEEHRAAARVAEIMAAEGFAVTTGAYGLDTAIEAVYGDGDLTVVICAEYDALPGVGHACGHNIIATAGVGAAIALKPVADRAGLRIKLLGTPAEEHGGGKVDLLQAGAWEDADFSLMVHGAAGVDKGATAFASTAVDRFAVTFTGVTAHAAGAPEQGINAASAAALSLNAIGFLRQHLPKSVNLNAFISLGGEATNIIPDEAVLQVEVRAYEIDTWRAAKKRVLACFEGSAIATGAGWSWAPTEHPYAPMEHDATLAPLWDANMERVGRVLEPGDTLGGGSTDMGNVSQVVPTLHGMIAVLGSEAVPHNPGFAADAVTPAGDDAALDGAAVIALTALDAALVPSVRAELKRRKAERPAGATRVTLEA